MDGWKVDGRANGWNGGLMESGWMEKWMDGWTDKRMDECKGE